MLVLALGKQIDGYRHSPHSRPLFAAVPSRRIALRRLAVSCVSVLGFIGNSSSAALAKEDVGVDILNPQINQARLGL